MASISAEKRDCVLVAVQRAKFPIAIQHTSRLGEHKWASVLVKEHGLGIEEAVTFAPLTAIVCTEISILFPSANATAHFATAFPSLKP